MTSHTAGDTNTQLYAPCFLLRQLGPGPDTWPNTDSYQGGAQTATGITITVTSATSYIMQFQVSGMGTRRRLSDGSLDPNQLDLQGYIPYGNATLATEEQMKEFKSPKPTNEEDLYRMYQNQGPAIPFDTSVFQNQIRGSATSDGGDGSASGSANASSSSATQSTTIIASVLTLLSIVMATW